MEVLARGAADLSTGTPPAESEFLERSRTILRATGGEDIYGTIRAIRRDERSFLAWAREQVERPDPQFPDFVCLKRQYDPELRFQSEWWRHYSPMFE